AGGAVHARALLALGEIEYVERPNEALHLLLAALAHTAGDPLLEAEVHLHVVSMADMDPVAATNAIRRAAEILEQPGIGADPTHVGCALLERALHDLLAGDMPNLADVERGLRLSTGATPTVTTGTSYVTRRAQEVAERCCWHLGRLTEARALDEAEYRRLTDTRQVGLLPPHVQALSSLTLLTGDWVAARRYARECADLVEQGEEAWRGRAWVALGRIHAFDGDLATAREIATTALARQDAAGDRWEGAIFCAMLGFIELSVPDAPAALGYLTRALDYADEIGVALPTQFRFLGD